MAQEWLFHRLLFLFSSMICCWSTSGFDSSYSAPCQCSWGLLLVATPMFGLSLWFSLWFFLSKIRWVSWVQFLLWLLFLSEIRLHWVNACIILRWWVILFLCGERRILISLSLTFIWIQGRGYCICIPRGVLVPCGRVWASMWGLILVNPTNCIMHWCGLTEVVSCML